MDEHVQRFMEQFKPFADKGWDLHRSSYRLRNPGPSDSCVG
jgi:hypothetical protein